MNKVLSILASAMFLISCASMPVPVNAADKPNILVMGEDADLDTVPCTSRVFKRVRAAVVNQLHDEGFNVYDETAVTLDDFAQGRCRRTDAEIVDVARKVQRPPIDVIAVFTIFGSKKQLSYTTNVKTRIEGRLLNVKSGQNLGNFEVDSPKEWVAPVKCDRECILEVIGTNAKTLAGDLGAALGIKLNAMLTDGGSSSANAARSSGKGLATAYTLKFDGFTPDNISSVEEYMVAFSGYKHHRTVTCGLRNCEYWYETESDNARLNRNLRMMLDRLGIKGRVQFSGNIFTVQKISTR